MEELMDGRVMDGGVVDRGLKDGRVDGWKSDGWRSGGLGRKGMRRDGTCVLKTRAGGDESVCHVTTYFLTCFLTFFFCPHPCSSCVLLLEWKDG